MCNTCRPTLLTSAASLTHKYNVRPFHCPLKDRPAMFAAQNTDLHNTHTKHLEALLQEVNRTQHLLEQYDSNIEVGSVLPSPFRHYGRLYFSPRHGSPWFLLAARPCDHLVLLVVLHTFILPWTHVPHANDGQPRSHSPARPVQQHHLYHCRHADCGFEHFQSSCPFVVHEHDCDSLG